MKVVALVSGGMDSVTAMYKVAKEHEVVAGICFDYGSKHNHCEIPCAKYHCDKLNIPFHVISLGFMNDLFKSDLLKSGGEIPEGHYEQANMKQTVVPFRNGIMLAILAGYTESIEADAIVLGAHGGDHAIYPDCRDSFIKSMGNAIREGTYNGVKIICPFINQTKKDIAIAGNELGVDHSHTWSCYKGHDKHCGKCGTCVERKEAFKEAGLLDPTIYE